MIGSLGWRGGSIPVVRFELISSTTDELPREGQCVVVMNRCRSAHGEPFYAIATDGLPRMVQVGEEDIVTEQRHLGVAESAAIKLGTEQVRIPNLNYVENQLMRARPESLRDL